jgi:hypothetical protein
MYDPSGSKPALSYHKDKTYQSECHDKFAVFLLHLLKKAAFLLTFISLTFPISGITFLIRANCHKRLPASEPFLINSSH